MGDRIENLTDFVAFVTANIRGSEKSEAQTFLSSFFQAFGHGGTVQARARYEEMICCFIFVILKTYVKIYV